MNNIENSIRYLQSNIKLRSYAISRQIRYAEDYLTLQCGSSCVKKIEDYKKEVSRCKDEIKILSNHQKIEKKMLAMMYDLQYYKNNNSWWIGNYAIKLDNL